jgi:hypothetical protein
MGVYYYLANDTKRQRVHYDHCIKWGPMTMNATVQSALVNYMVDNCYDTLRMVHDAGDMDDVYDYEEIDLASTTSR